MWPGPYGEWGSRKYLVASLRPEPQAHGRWIMSTSSTRHRPDPETPLEETMGALDYIVRSGQGAVRGHLLLQRRADPPGRRRSCAQLGTPCLIHQPVLQHVQPLGRGGAAGACSTRKGIGCIVFSPLAQGMLTDRYLDGIPADSRAAEPTRLPASPQHVTEEKLAKVRQLNEIAQARGQTHGADGHRLGAAPPGDDLGADRRQPRGSRSKRSLAR